MTAAVPPPDRKHLAKMLTTLARARPDDPAIGTNSKRWLAEYIKIAEDTIEQQARMMRADQAVATDMLAELGRQATELGTEINRLNDENARLTQALERTTPPPPPLPYNPGGVIR